MTALGVVAARDALVERLRRLKVDVYLPLATVQPPCLLVDFKELTEDGLMIRVYYIRDSGYTYLGPDGLLDDAIDLIMSDLDDRFSELYRVTSIRKGGDSRFDSLSVTLMHREAQ